MITNSSHNVPFKMQAETEKICAACGKHFNKSSERLDMPDGYLLECECGVYTKYDFNDVRQHTLGMV